MEIFNQGERMVEVVVTRGGVKAGPIPGGGEVVWRGVLQLNQVSPDLPVDESHGNLSIIINPGGRAPGDSK